MSTFLGSQPPHSASHAPVLQTSGRPERVGGPGSISGLLYPSPGTVFLVVLGTTGLDFLSLSAISPQGQTGCSWIASLLGFGSGRIDFYYTPLGRIPN